MRELRRVLVPEGWAAAFWNNRPSTPLFDDYEALLLEYSAEYRKMARFEETQEKIRRSPAIRDLREAALPNQQLFDHEGFLGRVYSSSFVVHGIDRREAFDAGLEALFQKHAREGQIAFGYRVEVLAWRLK